ncbi:MAG: serine/threonine protein kinase [Clostridia bacterium]|nr:serine/threonine protein kinase [Clostridia bacterium]
MDVFKKHIDEVFDDRYKIKREIGSGGMAIVYEAIDMKTGQSVALKMLKESISDNTQALRRFINESKAVAMMDHANIVKILDVSVKTEHKFIVMEYIKGITLRDYMNKKGQLHWKDACAFITQILQALDHAHMRGVIHRDIKPQNIMIMEGGFIKVTDFGIAKIPNAETVTLIDHAVGTIHYISPEQARGKKIDTRSDLYSLGVMFYEMVTGYLPFIAESSYEIMNKHINVAPKPPTQYLPQLPLGVEQIILCALEKDPTRRYQSASQMLRHIYRIQQDSDTVFQKQTPSRAATGDFSVRTKTGSELTDSADVPRSTSKTFETASSRSHNRNTKSPLRLTQTSDANKSHSVTNQKKPDQPESVPFSAVILICLVFFILAIVGFALLFTLLYKGKAAEIPPWITSVSDLAQDVRNLAMEMRRL